MSWIWNIFASIGRRGLDALNEAAEQARQAELRRKRDQGGRGIAPDENAQDWGQEDSSTGGQASWGQDTDWGSSGGGFWWQDSGAQGGIFGPSDTSYGDQGGGDFGTGDFGGGFDGGGDGGGGD